MSAPALGFELKVPGDVVVEKAEPVANHRLATGPVIEGSVPMLQQEGPKSTHVWRVSGSPTIGELAVPLRDQLIAEGFDILFDCTDQACGGFDFRFAVEVIPAPNMFVNLAEFRYLSFARDDAAGSLLVSRSGGVGYIQLILMGGPDPQSLPVVKSTRVAPSVATGPLARQLNDFGRVVLEDVAFATGSDALTDPNAPSLQALADYLAANAERTVALVGHTDAEGGLDGNIALSKRRADAVRRVLIETYGVSGNQVVSQGIGYLAPRASNLSDDGRSLNRRVEVVLTSTR